jgi:putative endopeptidase
MRCMRISTIVLSALFVPSLVFSQTQPLHGVDVSDIDRGVDPCTDFYGFANGAWRAKNPIPASMTRWSRRWQAGESSKDKLKALLESSDKNTGAAPGTPEQLIGDFYHACMDETGVNASGVDPLKPWFAKIDSISDPSGLERVITDLQDNGLTVPFTLTGQQDPHRPTQVLANLGAAGFAMPDRDYYLKPDARFKEARDKYRAHLVAMMTLAGWTPEAATKGAGVVLAMETKFAEAFLDNVALRDPTATDHNTTFSQLEAMVPHFGWTAYFEHQRLPESIDMNVDQPKYMAELDRQLRETPLADWKTYLKWHVLNAKAGALSAPFVDEHFAFYGHYLGGAAELKPRWKRCVESTDGLLGDALGKKYVEAYFPPEAKARMQELVRNLLLAMRDDILSRPWMSDETKERAMAKIATFNPKVGYPDTWKDYRGVVIKRDAYFDDVVSATRYAVADDRGTIGKPVDRGRWGMTPPTSDAYENPLLNEIVFPAGILQPPAFSVDAVDAVNYGAIGVVIGHEISHAFDDQGSQYDYLGRLRNWWTEADLARFKERGACVVDQFDQYEVDGGIRHNGKLVLGESIGDLGGAKLAFMAYRKSLSTKPRPADLDGFSPEQQFFIAWGQFRGDAIRPEQQRLMVQTDPHPIAKYRVNGPLSNLPEFRTAFSCKADAPMVRPDGKRCEVW